LALRCGERLADSILMALDPSGLPARAVELCAEGHCAEASDLLRPLAEREPADSDIWLLLARVELAAERYERALEAAEHTHDIAPSCVPADGIAGVALLRLGRTGEALGRARRAVDTDPRDSAAVVFLARVLSISGSHDEARAVAAHAVDLVPQEKDAHLAAGIVAAAAGDRDAARASFREVLALDPSDGAAQHELARLRLRRRVNDPAALASAASGFARTASTTPAATRSALSLERVLKTFLSKTAYLLFVDAFVVARVLASSHDTLAGLVPVALLFAPGYYAVRFLRRLTPTPRRRLVGMLVGERALATAATLEAISVAAILAAAVGSSSARPTFAGGAALTAFVARVLLYTALERATRAGRPDVPAVRAGLIWVIAGLLAMLAVALVAAATTKGRPGAGIGALICIGAAAGLARVAMRRRASG
jgi:Flp pilus assembly protein TadD